MAGSSPGIVTRQGVDAVLDEQVQQPHGGGELAHDEEADGCVVDLLLLAHPGLAAGYVPDNLGLAGAGEQLGPRCLRRTWFMTD
ncbi:hypothetical protein MAPG_05471 [Magnaporthiopsis poae ATCC 64411]|uniref:Uncharacterized protein n=1 Tax=Magnaporthiopsis poae (strain ATCC 64411 / 73-15) TaxID=644358 RepID=A0A0C4DZG9_MAGP6|nr:hypothetical protein MAPG_05471 [Magnaporthiopsis poae ATCC 64411]